MLPGTKVVVNGQPGVIVPPGLGARGRYGPFDSRREVMVRIGNRLRPFRKGDVEDAETVVSRDANDQTTFGRGKHPRLTRL